MGAPTIFFGMAAGQCQSSEPTRPRLGCMLPKEQMISQQFSGNQTGALFYQEMKQ